MRGICGFWVSLCKSSELAGSVGERTGLPRKRHFRDLLAWQKATELAREIYLRTEQIELACDMSFIDPDSKRRLPQLAI